MPQRADGHPQDALATSAPASKAESSNPCSINMLIRGNAELQRAPESSSSNTPSACQSALVVQETQHDTAGQAPILLGCYRAQSDSGIGSSSAVAGSSILPGTPALLCEPSHSSTADLGTARVLEVIPGSTGLASIASISNSSCADAAGPPMQAGSQQADVGSMTLAATAEAVLQLSLQPAHPAPTDGGATASCSAATAAAPEGGQEATTTGLTQQDGTTSHVQDCDTCLSFGTSVFFARVPPTVPYEEILELFQEFGNVVSLNLFRPWATAKTSKVRRVAGCGQFVVWLLPVCMLTGQQACSSTSSTSSRMCCLANRAPQSAPSTQLRLYGMWRMQALFCRNACAVLCCSM